MILALACAHPVPIPVPAPLPDGCAAPGLILGVEPNPLALVCAAGLRDCAATATLTVRSCASREVRLSGWQLQCRDQVSYDRGGSPEPVPFGGEPATLAPGQSWTTPLPMTLAGTCEVSLGPMAVDGPTEDGYAPVTLTVTNPATDAALAACDACGGTWGPLGLAQIPACVCPTRDAGKPCTRAEDCTVACVSRDGEPFHCKEDDSPFGCFRYLPAGGAPPGKAYEQCAD